MSHPLSVGVAMGQELSLPTDLSPVLGSMSRPLIVVVVGVGGQDWRVKPLSMAWVLPAEGLEAVPATLAGSLVAGGSDWASQVAQW